MRPRSARRPRAVPTILQVEAEECGAACLAMILAGYRRWVPLETLRTDCAVSRDGARASAILRAARQHGLAATGRACTPEEIATSDLPGIAFWQHSHFVVLERIGPGGAVVNDPASGRRRLDRAAFAQAFSGTLLVLEPGPAFRPGGRRPSIVPALRRAIGADRVGAAIVVVWTLLAVVPRVLAPAALRTFTDDVLARRFDDWVLPLALGLLAVAVAGGAVSWAQLQCLNRVQVAIAARMAGHAMDRILRLPHGALTQLHPADLAMRLALCQELGQLMSGPLPLGLINLAIAFLVLPALLVYSVPLTLVALGLCGITVAASLLRQHAAFSLNAAMLGARSRLSAVSTGGLIAMETLKASGGEDAFFRLWAGRQAEFAGLTQRLAWLSTWLGLAPAIMGTATAGAILGAGAWLIIDGQLTLGGLLAFQLLQVQVTGPLQNQPDLVGRAQHARAIFARVRDLLEMPVAGPGVTEADPDSPILCLDGGVTCQGVSAAYGPDAPIVLHDVSFTVAPGERVAFVGPTGSGKSTLVRLLSGVMAPTAGVVRLDGTALADLPRATFHANVAVVEQDVQLFAGSVIDNLTMWDETVGLAAAMEAARDAEVHDVIAALPGGYDALLEAGGANLSGGERQRIEIARALVRRPSVLILDEATSMLDALTERAVMDNLRRRGCTCLIVAHRLSSIRDCDRIMVLQAGRIVEQGRHEELLARAGVYAALIRAA